VKNLRVDKVLFWRVVVVSQSSTQIFVARLFHVENLTSKASLYTKFYFYVQLLIQSLIHIFHNALSNIIGAFVKERGEI
jgi:hypothetical protein